MTYPVVVTDDVIALLARYFRRREDGVREWINKPIPAFGGLSAADFVGAGHSWAEVAEILDGMGQQRG